MAAPSYTTDLAPFKDFEAATTLGEMAGYTVTGSPALDTDYPIQGNQHVSAAMTKTGLGSIMADYGSNVSWTSGWAFFVWGVFLPAGAVDVFANGGLQVLIGSDITANYKGWKVGGKDFGRYPYGGWQNFAVDPEQTADYSGGTLAGYRWAGVGCNCIAGISKGVPFGLDCIRYGRGQLLVTAGDLANGYATCDGMATVNDASTARWGLFQYQAGSYLWKGLWSLGSSGTAVDFRDTNRNIIVDNTLKVYASFNKIEVNNAGSRVDWTNINITSLGTVSRGNFEAIANATINKIDCAFTDMGTFVYLSNSVLLRVTYRRCDLVTQNGALFTDCLFENCFTAVSLKASNVTLVTGCSFVSDGSNHAVEATTAGDYDWNNELTGYATSDGSTGNEAFYNNSGGHINLTVVGGTRPYVKNGSGATTTVIIPDVTLTISAPVSLVGAEIRIYDMNGTLPFLGDELAGTESHDAATYAYSGAASNVIWIQIMKNGYVEFGQRFTMPTASGAFFAKLEADTNA